MEVLRLSEHSLQHSQCPQSGDDVWTHIAPLHMRITLDHQHCYTAITPVLLHHPKADILLSPRFLAKHYLVRDQDSGLIQNPKPKQAKILNKTNSTDNGYTVQPARAQTINPNTMQWIDLKVHGIDKGEAHPGDGLLIPTNDILDTPNVSVWTSAILKADPQGHLKVQIQNARSLPLQLPLSYIYGKFYPIPTLNVPSQPSIAFLKTPQTNVTTPTPLSKCTTLPEGGIQKNQKKTDKPMNFEECEALVIEGLQLDKAGAAVTEKEKQDLKELMVYHVPQFVWPDGPMKKKPARAPGWWQVHDIHLVKGGDRPVNVQFLPLPPGHKAEELKKKIQQWEAQGIVKAAQSPWNYALIASPVDDNKRSFNWALDLRQLNKNTVREPVQLGQPGDNLQRLARSKIFSVLQGPGAYRAIPMGEASKQVVSFSTPYGQFRFEKIPFGLANAGRTHQRLLQTALGNLDTESLVPYMEDLLIHTKTWKEHLQVLHRVLSAYKKAGLILQPELCQIGRNTVSYLGRKIDAQGVRIDPELTEAINGWPKPETRADLAKFVAITDYYKDSLKNYNALVAPLKKQLPLKRKPKEDQTTSPPALPAFQMTSEMDAAYEQLKERLTQPPVMAFPCFNPNAEPLILDTDWSLDYNGVGGALSQTFGGVEKALAYGSYRLGEEAQNASSYTGEMLAVLHFMELWEPFLLPRKFILRVDNRALLFWHTLKGAPDGLLGRWLRSCARLDFVVQHRSGVKHTNADSLSRRGGWPSDPKTTIQPSSDPPYIATVHGHQITHQDWEEEQRKDTNIRPLFEWLNCEALPDDQANEVQVPSTTIAAALWDLRRHMFVDPYHTLCYTIGGNRPAIPVVPHIWTQKILTHVHESNDHADHDETARLSRMSYLIPDLDNYVAQALDQCETCRPPTIQETSPQWPFGLKGCCLFQWVTLSIIDCARIHYNWTQPKYLLAVVDVATAWVEVHELRSKSPSTIALVMGAKMGNRYGPTGIVEYTARRKNSGEVPWQRQVAQLLGTGFQSYQSSHKTSGSVSQHVALKDVLRKYLSRWGGRNPTKGPPAWAAKAACQYVNLEKIEGHRPFDQVFNRDPEASLEPEYVAGLPKSREPSWEDLTHMHRAHAMVSRRLIGVTQVHQRDYYASRPRYRPGQRVWLFTPTRYYKGQPRGWDNYWTGPWMVSAPDEAKRSLQSDQYHLVLNLPGAHHTAIVRQNRMRRYHDTQLEVGFGGADNPNLRLDYHGTYGEATTMETPYGDEVEDTDDSEEEEEEEEWPGDGQNPPPPPPAPNHEAGQVDNGNQEANDVDQDENDNPEDDQDPQDHLHEPPPAAAEGGEVHPRQDTPPLLLTTPPREMGPPKSRTVPPRQRPQRSHAPARDSHRHLSSSPPSITRSRRPGRPRKPPGGESTTIQATPTTLPRSTLSHHKQRKLDELKANQADYEHYVGTRVRTEKQTKQSSERQDRVEKRESRTVKRPASNLGRGQAIRTDESRPSRSGKSTTTTTTNTTPASTTALPTRAATKRKRTEEQTINFLKTIKLFLPSIQRSREGKYAEVTEEDQNKMSQRDCWDPRF